MGPYYIGLNFNDPRQGPILDGPILIPIITLQLNCLKYLVGIYIIESEYINYRISYVYYITN
jgi:hypothetical protein